MNHKMLNFSGVVCNISEGSAKVFHSGGLLRSSTKSRGLLGGFPKNKNIKRFQSGSASDYGLTCLKKVS